MHLLTAENAAAYLAQAGLVPQADEVGVQELSGGVSNVVLQVTGAIAGPHGWVLKQARPQLRVAEPWFCSVERIWREVQVLRVCESVLAARPEPAGWRSSMPRVLFEDRDNYLFVMTAAPAHQVWKQQLLSGRVSPAIALACGRLLGDLHTGTWRRADLLGELRDRSFFIDLRVDPYYRQVARNCPELRSSLERLIESLDRADALVHGDFSPKNLLISAGQIMLVDCEVGHAGDPAFDLGFLLSHLVLKAVHAEGGAADYLGLIDPLWQGYREAVSSRIPAADFQALVTRTVHNFLGCFAARVDGKSPVEYLSAGNRERVRAICRRYLPDPPADWEAMQQRLNGELGVR